MIRYLEVNKLKYLDRFNWLFMPKESISKPFEVEVLHPYWSHGDKDEHKEFAGVRFAGGFPRVINSVYRRTKTLVLNQLKVEFVDRQQHAIIKYFDKKLMRTVALELKAHMQEDFEEPVGEYVMNASWTCDIDTESDVKHEVLISTKLNSTFPLFEAVSGLGYHMKMWSHWYCTNYNWGILNETWPLYCQNKPLGKNVYALLCGSWAILLTDSFKFDALVALNGVYTKQDNQQILDILRVIHTVNPDFEHI